MRKVLLHTYIQSGTIGAGQVRGVLLHAYISLEGSDKIGTKQKKLLQHYQYHEHTTVEQHLHLINDSLYK